MFHAVSRWSLGCLCAVVLATSNAPRCGAEGKGSSRSIINLFSDEIQQVTVKLKWRGERLTDDTLYAAALTGLSWEPSWGKEHLFSLAWGDLKKISNKKRAKNAQETISQVLRLTSLRQYQQAIDAATATFSLEEIGCDVLLKESIGRSFFAMGQPERAFPIFACPFDPARTPDSLPATNRKLRESAFETAQRAGLPRSAIAFALSLLLEPGNDMPQVHRDALQYLEAQGVDLDRVMLGILQAPERLRGLPRYYYAAADLLVARATPRLLPFLMHLAQSDDVYLRSRALLGLGVAGYRKRSGDPGRWSDNILPGANLREYGLSVGERKLIDREIKEAANDGSYRLRTAAALAAGLLGDEEYLPLLQKLSRDRAYVLSPVPPRTKNPRRTILFPVRMASAAGLARHSVQFEPGGGEMDKKALDTAKHQVYTGRHDQLVIGNDAATSQSHGFFGGVDAVGKVFHDRDAVVFGETGVGRGQKIDLLHTADDQV